MCVCVCVRVCVRVIFSTQLTFCVVMFLKTLKHPMYIRISMCMFVWHATIEGRGNADEFPAYLAV